VQRTLSARKEQLCSPRLVPSGEELPTLGSTKALKQDAEAAEGASDAPKAAGKMRGSRRWLADGLRAFAFAVFDQ
jgi:hypothetical protein